jgi:4-amino-4-deoxy-L-arabinose transferase-like glycosyltransferase
VPRFQLRREDTSRLLILAAAWISLFVAVDPRGQFPLNDDFQYAECARRWLSGGGLRLPEWALSSTVSHALLGAVVTAPWGATNQALRMWMLALGLLGAAGVYALARRWRADPNAALLAALTAALSPVYAVLSASFHLDVTAAVLTLAGLYAFLRGRERGSVKWLTGASALIALSGLARQTGFLCAVGGAASLAWDRKLTPRTASALLVPAGLAAAAFWAWFHFVHGPTWAWESGAYTPKSGSYWLSADVWGALFSRAGKSAQMSALFLSPLAVLRWRNATRKSGRPEFFAALLLIGSALIAWERAHGLALLQNTLSHNGLGAVTLMGADDKPAGWWQYGWLWNAAALIALASSLVALLSLTEELRGPLGGELRAAALFVGAPYGAMLMMPVLYDRYLLVFLPAAAAALAAGRSGKTRAAFPAFAAAALMAFFTWAGLKDYFSWNRARWAAGMDAVAHGVPPNKVENGYDWDGQYSLTKNIATLRVHHPASAIGLWDWQLLNRIVIQTAFSEKPAQADWILLATYPYETPFVSGGGVVRVFAEPGAIVRPGVAPISLRGIVPL